jgi:hypothetical protein
MSAEVDMASYTVLVPADVKLCKKTARIAFQPLRPSRFAGRREIF